MGANSLLFKLATCFIAGLVFAALLLLLGNGGTVSWFPPLFVFTLAGACLVAGIAFPFIWQHGEKTGKLDPIATFAKLHALIRYGIAFNLASFGWKKLFGLQFIVPVEIASAPMNQQSGEWLTWYYFGYSGTYGMILAAIQLAGAYLLLFRKTMLLAEIILFSLMINLTLVNICYAMNTGALLQSVVITLGLIFLILLEYKKLFQFFLKAASHLPYVPFSNLWNKNMVRLSAMALSLLYTLYLKASGK